jgi:Dolichyl-phosphate-mannose-protein mannosyltransferase
MSTTTVESAAADQGAARGGWLSRRTPGQRTAIALGFLLLLVALPLRGLLRTQGPPMEEGFMLVFPERVLAGDVPNVDFLHLYGPGGLWVLAGAFKLFGTSLEVERLVGFVQQLAIIGGVFALARRWGRTVAVLSAVIALFIILPPIGLTALAWVGALGLALLGLAAGLEARRSDGEPRSDWWAVLAGVLFAVALLYRIDIVVGIALGGGAVLWGGSRRLQVRLVAGLGVAVIGYVVHLAMAGIDATWQGMIIDPVFHLRGGRGLPLPPSWNEFDGALQRLNGITALDWPIPALRSPSQLSLMFFLVVASVGFIMAVGIRAIRRDRTSMAARTLLVVALFSLGILFQAFQRADSTHLAWAGCVPLAFVPIALLDLLTPRTPRWSVRTRGLVTGGTVLVALLVLIPHFAFRSYIDYSLQSFDQHRSARAITRGDRTFYYGAKDVADAVHKMIPAIEKVTKPGDRLFVGPADLRKTPFSDAYLYYLFPELPPATYYIEMDPGVANAPHSRLVHDIKSADVLVLSSVWNDWDEPNDSRVFGPDAPNKVVKREFCKVGDYGGKFQLLVRCKK